MSPLFLILGKVYQTHEKLKRKRNDFHAKLMDTLYRKNIDNNRGVLSILQQELEAQEVREACLCYFFLWRQLPKDAASKGRVDHTELRRSPIESKAALDEQIEGYLSELHGGGRAYAHVRVRVYPCL